MDVDFKARNFFFIKLKTHKGKPPLLLQVDVLNKVKTHYKKIRKYTRKTDLLFYEQSPNYCDPNPEVGAPGTSGRLCNKTSSGADNCETLCCGRGYNTLRVKRTERCDCKFHWCCYVVCQTCEYNEWVTVCKWCSYKKLDWFYCVFFFLHIYYWCIIIFREFTSYVVFLWSYSGKHFL